jgi:MFS family permease
VTTGSRRDLLIAFSGIMLATLLAALDQTIVATALPRIASDLNAFEQLSWVVTSYLLASTITIPLYGKLSDLFGRRRLFVVAISLFLAGSVLCAAASTLGQLVAFRALQGFGAGGLLPLSQAAIGDLFPPRERGRYQGLVGSMWATAAVAGPLLGGALTDHAAWRWIFLVNVPLAGAALVAVVRTMPGSADRRHAAIDWAGAALLTIATAGLLLACMWGGTSYPWRSPPVLAAAAVGVAAAGALVVERRVREPFLPLPLLRSPVPRVTAAGFPLVGGCFAVAGTLLLTTAGVESSNARIAATLALTGAGMGMTWPVYMVATQNAVARDELGTASGALLFVRTMAGSVGIAILGAVLNARLGEELGRSVGTTWRVDSIDPAALAASLHTVFVLLVPLAVALLAVAVALKELPLRDASEKQSLTQDGGLDTVAT